MGETSNQIEREIRVERTQLDRNLDDLQSKVEEVTNWRAQFQKRPMVMIGFAIGGGLLLGSVSGRRSTSRRYDANTRAGEGQPHRRGTELQKYKALETFDTIKGALIGVAANTFQDFLGQLIPSFREQFQKTAQEKRSAVASPTATGGHEGDVPQQSW
jgi:hypothetical protein